MLLLLLLLLLLLRLLILWLLLVDVLLVLLQVFQCTQQHFSHRLLRALAHPFQMLQGLQR
jgi:hypothetical protein